MSIVGRTYLERGKPVTIVGQWRGAKENEQIFESKLFDSEAAAGPFLVFKMGGRQVGPRNVLIRREDGTLVVRPFRGLRKASDDSTDRPADDGGDSA